MPEAATRLLVVVLDAAEPTLVRRWAAEGRLPALAGLMARGLSGQVRSLEGFFVGSTWPSLYTGTHPATHGFHYTVQLTPGTYDLHHPADRGLTDVEPFWRALGRAGKRTAIVDVPLVPVDPSINGLHVTEWGGHDALYGFATAPAAAGAALLERHGRHPVPPNCDGSHRTADDYATLVDALERGARTRGALMRDVLADGPWDLVLHAFSETHCVGHQCWHLHDEHHPAHDPEVAARLGDPLLRVYRAADAALGEMLEGAGNVPVIVCSGHGMGHWYGAHFLLRDILVRLGVCAVPEPQAPGLAARAWQALPLGVRHALRPLREALRREEPNAARHAPSLGIIPERSACFVVGNGLAVSGIRLNLAGREPAGVLTPGAEAERFEERLMAELGRIVDTRTGDPVIRRVRRTRDLHAGPALHALPDLLVEWDDRVATGSTVVGTGRQAEVRVHSPTIGELSGTNEYGRTGEHRQDGFLVAAGPGMGHGTLERPVELVDLAPTIAARLGVALGGVDGTAVAELIGAG